MRTNSEKALLDQRGNGDEESTLEIYPIPILVRSHQARSFPLLDFLRLLKGMVIRSTVQRS